MNIRSLFVALVSAFLVAAQAAPALAAGQPAPRQGWRDAVERLAAQAAQLPPGIRLQSVVVAEIREGRTQARWPLSDALERDLAKALARRNPPFAVVGESAAPGRADADGASERALLPGGSYAMLTGTFTRSAGGDLRVDLLVRDLASQATLYRLAAATVAAADLPSGAAPGVGFGKLVLTVEPATAQVFVDGRPVGRAPLALTLPAGPHALTVAAEGFDVYDEPVDLEAEAAKALTIRLKRPSFTLSIESNVPGAITRIDGKERGATPLSIKDLAPGKHRIAVSADGYKPFEADLDWSGQKSQVFRALLAQLPGSLVVTADVGDAAIEVDGAVAGRAPLMLQEIGPGQHTVRVTASGQPPFERSVEVTPAGMSHLRARLAPDSVAEAVSETVPHMSDFADLAIVARTRGTDDVALATAIQERLQALHPEVSLADPGHTARLAQAAFQGEVPDPTVVRSLARAARARQVAVVGVTTYEPFARVGLWPVRPVAKGEIALTQADGPLYPQVTRVEQKGPEPWLGSNQVPGKPFMTARLAEAMADQLAGRSPEAPVVAERTLPNTISAYLGDTRPSGAYSLPGAGMLYERRVFDWLELGAGYAYGNALGADFTKGTQIKAFGAGNDLIFGVGQNQTLRLDALARMDGPVPAGGPWYEGPTWAPFLGAGFRLNVPYYYVYGVNRKVSEGGWVAWEPQGSVLGGIKVFTGGLVLRAELEVPVVVLKEDPGAPHFAVGGGWMF